MTRGITSICLVTFALLGARAARADVVVRGVVVQIEAGEVYFDLGAQPGLAVGTPVRLKRPITLKHPVTGKLVKDELPLAEGTVSAVGDALSMVALAGAADVKVGDVIEAKVARMAATPPPPPPKSTPLPQLDPATARVLAVWTATVGKPLEARIAAWERYLAAGAEEPFAARVREDLELLRAQRARLADPMTEPAIREPELRGIEHDAPSSTISGEPLALAFAARDPERIAQAWVHVRPRGVATYRRVPLRRDGDGALRGELPADVIEAPGVEYFAEVVTTQGVVGTAVGTPERPISVEVEPSPYTVFTGRANRSRVSIISTYLDYATFDKRAGDHRDQFFQLETDFTYRLYEVPYAIRSGFGVINGYGGYVDPRPGQDLAQGFNYGYGELEFRFAREFAFLARVVAGVGDEGLGFGGESRIRLGDEQETNLTFVLSKIEDVGFLSEMRIEWRTFARFPLGFAVGLSDQPNAGDLGVRFTGDLGWRARSWLQPTLRVSYQGRNVDHSGIGVGGGLVFDW